MTRDEFVEKEIKRTEGLMPYGLLLSALVVNVIIIGKSEPIVIGIFVVGAVLGIVAGYKLAFDRIRRK